MIGRLSTMFGATTIATALVLLGSGLNATAATSTTSTPKLDPITAACVKRANAAYKKCGSGATCGTTYKAAIAACFPAGKGASCGGSCASKKVPCDATVQAALTTCQQGCSGSRDVTCASACKGQAYIDGQVCKTDFSACLAKCPTVLSVTTTTVPRSSTTTTLARSTTTTLRPTTTTTTAPRPTVTSTTLHSTITTTTLKPLKTTTTSVPRPTTTTTTLPPLPPFSAATKACIDRITTAQVACIKAKVSPTACQAAYNGAFPSCFKPGAGAACAAGCVNVDDACEMPWTAGKSACSKACQNAWVNAGPRCHGDASCIADTIAAFQACPSGCSRKKSRAQCRGALAVCLTTCTNLEDVGGTTTTTTTLQRTTTSMSTSSTSTSSTSTSSTTLRPTTTSSTIVRVTTSTSLRPTTTSTTVKRTTTTSTTVPAPHSGFSPATAACIKLAVANLKACQLTMTAQTCKAEYRASYAQCFAPGPGVTCATDCWTKRKACEDPTQLAETACIKTCAHDRSTALTLCQSADTICSSGAQTAYLACKQACADQGAPTLQQCSATFDGTILGCPGL